MTACERCGDMVDVPGEDRTRVMAYDLADSSGSWFDGRLCADCWGELVEFLADRRDPVEVFA